MGPARPVGFEAIAWPSLGLVTGGEREEGHPSLIFSLIQAGCGAAGPEAETEHSSEPPEGQCCRALAAEPAGYQGLAREWGGALPG